MQLDMTQDVHYSYLKQVLGISKTQFHAICASGEAKVDALLDKLYDLRDQEWGRMFDSGKEFSQEETCISELIDILAGPYEEEEDAQEDRVVAHRFSIYNKEQLAKSLTMWMF